MRQRGMSVLRSDIGMLLILNLVLTFAIPGIAIGGHIGGLIGGGICGVALLAPRRERRWWELIVPMLVMVASVAVVVLGGLELAASGLRRRSRGGGAGCSGGRSSSGPRGATTRLASPTSDPVVVHPPAGPVPERLVAIGLERHAGRLAARRSEQVELVGATRRSGRRAAGRGRRRWRSSRRCGAATGSRCGSGAAPAASGAGRWWTPPPRPCRGCSRRP